MANFGRFVVKQTGKAISADLGGSSDYKSEILLD